LTDVKQEAFMHERKAIRTEGAPLPIGPYEQAVIAGPFVFLSGQIGLDPGTGKMVTGGIAEQTERVFENMKAVLEASGSSLARVVRVGVYLADMSDFAAVNEIYSKYMAEGKPARSAIAVKGLPAGALVEMDAVALA
jgi:2-iminobutanoate/2-iminopropanoate deaminase